MTISEIIQNIATGGAVFLGITYIIGGLIVNLNLARRGVVEFQIIKVKYLVAGLIFLFQSLGSFILAIVVGIVAVVYQVPSTWLQVINIISFVSGVSLLMAWARLPTNSTSFFASWRFWLTASIIGASFPAIVFIRQLFFQHPLDVFEKVFFVQALLTGILTLIGQIYHYAAFYYGKPSTIFGTLDPIGIGIPSRIRIACTQENAALLKNLGVSFNKQNVTTDLFLVDETDHDYLVAFETVPDQNKSTGTLKIDKSLVKVILYLAEMKEIK